MLLQDGNMTWFAENITKYALTTSDLVGSFVPEILAGGVQAGIERP